MAGTVNLIETPSAMREWARNAIRSEQTIGFVPTMGALHEGHKQLIERARQENDLVAVSIFVNPTQFGPGEDFKRYPRSLDTDLEICEAMEVDAVFAPALEDMYDKDARTYVEIGGLQDNLCGISRPGHFRGVATVVTKLFNIVLPDRAYFGCKDAQQLRIVEVLARDLSFGCEIVGCETVRDADGLALSSRNRYLSADQRRQALSLNRALAYCERKVIDGERDALKLAGEMYELVGQEPDAEIDYIAIVDSKTLEDVKTIEGDLLVACAVKFGQTRLIDNIRLHV